MSGDGRCHRREGACWLCQLLPRVFLLLTLMSQLLTDSVVPGNPCLIQSEPLGASMFSIEHAWSLFMAQTFLGCLLRKASCPCDPGWSTTFSQSPYVRILRWQQGSWIMDFKYRGLSLATVILSSTGNRPAGACRTARGTKSRSGGYSNDVTEEPRSSYA